MPAPFKQVPAVLLTSQTGSQEDAPPVSHWRGDAETGQSISAPEAGNRPEAGRLKNSQIDDRHLKTFRLMMESGLVKSLMH
jgi:hypothetical protein